MDADLINSLKCQPISIRMWGIVLNNSTNDVYKSLRKENVEMLLKPKAKQYIFKCYLFKAMHISICHLKSQQLKNKFITLNKAVEKVHQNSARKKQPFKTNLLFTAPFKNPKFMQTQSSCCHYSGNRSLKWTLNICSAVELK